MLDKHHADKKELSQQREQCFDFQPLWKKACIVAVGPGINFLFAILLLFFIFYVPQEQVRKPILGEVPAQSFLAQNKVNLGDTLLSVDAKPFMYFSQHDVYILRQILAKKPLHFTIRTPQGVRRSFTCNPPINNRS